jgi:hypothetical protein
MMTLDDRARLLGCVAQLDDRATIVEFGCGGSTLMLAKALKPTQSLVSIEHNPEWFAKIRDAVKSYPNVYMYLRTPDSPVDGLWPFANPGEETPTGCEGYINAVNTDIDWYNSVDMVFVDGFVRGAVLAAVRSKIPYWKSIDVFLHDYVGREWWYDWAVNLYYRVWVATGFSADDSGKMHPNTLLHLST